MYFVIAKHVISILWNRYERKKGKANLKFVLRISKNVFVFGKTGLKM